MTANSLPDSATATQPAASILEPQQLVLPSLLAMLNDLVQRLPPAPEANPTQAAHLLQQAVHAMQVVHLHGMARMAQTMGQVLLAPVPDPEAAARTTQLLQLAAKDLNSQLRMLQSQGSSTPQAMFTTYRALVKLGGKDTAHPADLWTPQGNASLAQIPATVAALHPSDSVRAQMDQQVLAFIKTSDPNAIHALGLLCQGLAQTAPTVLQCSVWHIAAGWTDALTHGLLEADLFTKRLASRLLIQYAMQTRGDTHVPELLIRDLLFYCDQAVQTSQHHLTDLPSVLQAVCYTTGLLTTASSQATEPVTTQNTPEPSPAPPDSDSEPTSPVPSDTAHATDIPEFQPTDALMQGSAALPQVTPNQAFLAEADDISRMLEKALIAWSRDTDPTPLPDTATIQASELTRSAWAAGCADISTLAHTLQRILPRMGNDVPTAQRQVCLQTAEEIRRLLNQFAAGFIRRPHPQVLEALHALQAQLPSPAASDSVDANHDAASPDAATSRTEHSDSTDTHTLETSDNHSDSAKQSEPCLDNTLLDPVRFAVFEEEVLSIWPPLQVALQRWIDVPTDTASRQALLRGLHTLKGSARLADAMAWAAQVHTVEDLALTRADKPQALQQPLEALRMAFIALQQEMAVRHPERAAAHWGQRPLDTVARHAQALWSTNDSAQTALKDTNALLTEMEHCLQRLYAQIKDCAAWADTLMLHGDMDLPYEWHEELGELVRGLNNCTDDIGTVQRQIQHGSTSAAGALGTQSGHLRALQHTLMYARLLPLTHIAQRLKDTVRLAVADTGKPTDLVLQGADTVMERDTLEALAPALEHLLRNSVAHGIETAQQRIACGKSASGRITIALRTLGTTQTLIVQDDGSGLDTERIRAQASALGLIAAQDNVDATRAAQLILHPGLSTASQVTELAGRGIGMDAVQAQIRELGGQLSIASVPGKGCRFVITLPAPPQVEQVLGLRAGNWRIAVPARGVEALRQVPYEQARQALEQGMLRDDIRGPMPLYWAGAVWQQSTGSHEAPLDGQTLILVLRSDTRRFGLVVDEVLGTQEVVLQPPTDMAVPLPGLLGTAAQPSGQVLQVYEPAPVVAAHETRLQAQPPTASNHSAPVEIQAERPRVMLVDDSISVRRLAQHLLQSNGYQVTTVADGLQALEQLEHTTPDVLLVDIEMPDMNGMELLRRVRAEDRWRQLPIVMLTAHEPGPVSQKAIDLGAQAYLTKPYSPAELLAQVKRYCAIH